MQVQYLGTSKVETTVQTIMQQMQWTCVIEDAKKTFVKKSHQSMGIDLSYLTNH